MLVIVQVHPGLRDGITDFTLVFANELEVFSNELAP
jgi:hypothetical protein